MTSYDLSIILTMYEHCQEVIYNQKQMNCFPLEWPGFELRCLQEIECQIKQEYSQLGILYVSLFQPKHNGQT